MEAFVLAAGKGTRMKSRIPKPLQKVGGEPIIFHTIRVLRKADLGKVTIITGYKAALIEEAVSKNFRNIRFLRQERLGGSGEAILSVLSKKKLKKSFIVLNSDDSLFYDPKDIKEIIKSHKKKNASVSLFLTTETLGRKYRKVILDRNKNFKKFTKRQAKSGFTITGLYIFEPKFIEQSLKKIQKRQGELGLTDFMYLPSAKRRINCFLIDPKNWFGINTKEELKLARKIWK